MKLLYTPNFENNIISKIITVKEFGDGSWTAEDEINLLKNTNPTLQYKDLTFSGKFKVGADKNIIVDEENGEEISLSIINKIIPINEDFKAEFIFDTKDVKQSEIGTMLSTKELVAEAKSLLFENVITKAVQVIVKNIKDNANDYEIEKTSETF